MNLAVVRSMLKKNEGVRFRTYKDSLGIPTIGVGLNLQRADAPARLRMVGADPDLVIPGVRELTPAQVDALLDEDIAACVASVRDLVPNFDSLPEPVQHVLIDMRFQLGAGGLKSFKNTLAAFKARDWKKAAAGLRSSLAYQQTPVRWERNAKVLDGLA